MMHGRNWKAGSTKAGTEALARLMREDAADQRRRREQRRRWMRSAWRSLAAWLRRLVGRGT